MNKTPTVAFVLLLAGCAAAPEPATHHEPAPAEPAAHADASFADSFAVDAADWASSGRNPFFVLEPGWRLEYEGTEHGRPVTLAITVLDETKVVDGVETRVVEERETENGLPSEVSRNYFALSKRDGSVYYFGEDVDEYEHGKLSGHGGSWHAGVHGARFGLMMPGTPVLGARYCQEVAPHVAMDRAEIVSLTDTYETPAGKFENCLKVRETSPLDKGHEIKIYAPGVGQLQDGAMKLVRYGSGRK